MLRKRVHPRARTQRTFLLGALGGSVRPSRVLPSVALSIALSVAVRTVVVVVSVATLARGGLLLVLGLGGRTVSVAGWFLVTLARRSA